MNKREKYLQEQVENLVHHIHVFANRGGEVPERVYEVLFSMQRQLDEIRGARSQT